MTTTEMIDAELRSYAEHIKSEIRGGQLFGRPIDVDNLDLDQAIVAAYELGRSTVYREQQRNREMLRLFDRR